MAEVSKRIATDETLKELVAAIKNTESVQQAKAEIQAEGATQVANVTAAAEAITGKVAQIDSNTKGIGELKSDLDEFTKFIDSSIPILVLWEIGNINSAGADVASDKWIRTVGFINLSVCNRVEISLYPGYFAHIVEYDIDKSFIRRKEIYNAFVYTKAEDAYFARVTMKKINDESISESDGTNCHVYSNPISLKSYDAIGGINAIPYCENIGDYYIKSNGEPVDSVSWNCMKINASNILELKKVKLWSNANNIAIAFYSDDTISTSNYIGGYAFTSPYGRQEFENIKIPYGAKCIVFANRKASSTDIAINAMLSNITEKLDDKLSIISKDVKNLNAVAYSYLENEIVATQNAYIDTSGATTNSVNWKLTLYSTDNIISLDKVVAYTNSESMYAITFYSDTDISTSNFISGISFTKTGRNVIENIIIPTNAKAVAITTRTASSDEFVVEGYAKEKKNVCSYVGGLKAIHKSVAISNDFCFVGDELWTSEIIDVSTESTKINRYKWNYNRFVRMSQLSTDFGHWNSVSYNPNNDCLLFTDSSNNESSGTNLYVIKNPSALSGTVTKEDVAVHYTIDLGYKLNLVWGYDNVGNNNIVVGMYYKLVDGTRKQHFIKILLKKTNDEFNGEYLVLSDVDAGANKSVNGMYWYDGILYFGSGNEDRAILNKYNEHTNQSDSICYDAYNDDGTIVKGTVQGIHIDKDYLWLHINGRQNGTVFGYLMQYYR